MTDHRRTACVVGLAILLVAANAPRLGAQASPGSTPYLDSEHGLTIEELVTLALQHSPAVAAITARIDVARGNLAQASARANPAATVGGATELGGPDSQIILGVSWPLELFRRDARTDLAKREVDVMVFDARASQWQLAAMVRRQAANALAAVARLDLLRQNGAAAHELRDLLVAGVDTGARPRLEADVVEIETRRIEAAALRQDGEVRSSIAVLRGLIGIEPDAPLTFKRSLEAELSSVVPATAQLVEDRDRATLALAGRPDVARAAARVAVAAADRHRADQAGRFDMDLAAGYMRTDTSFPQLGLQSDGAFAPVANRFHMLTFGATVNLPLLNRNQGAVSAATAGERAADRDRIATELVARAELAAATARWSATRQAVAVYTGGLRDLEERNVNVVQETYRLGGAALADVLAERRRALEIDANYTDLLLDLYDADVAVRQALGVIR